jgi:UPF0148 protein
MSTEEDVLQRMSELLLSKAVMLQYHCGGCKSPLFEKDGRVICPKCGPIPVKRDDQGGEESEASPPPRTTLGGSTVQILEKKKVQLLAMLEAETDPKKITDLLEAIGKLESMLG